MSAAPKSYVLVAADGELLVLCADNVRLLQLNLGEGAALPEKVRMAGHEIRLVALDKARMVALRDPAAAAPVAPAPVAAPPPPPPAPEPVGSRLTPEDRAGILAAVETLADDDSAHAELADAAGTLDQVQRKLEAAEANVREAIHEALDAASKELAALRATMGEVAGHSRAHVSTIGGLREALRARHGAAERIRKLVNKL